MAAGAEFLIVEAKAYHCGLMARKLRTEHLNAVLALGINPHRELRHCFDVSSFRRAWLIDGKLAAIGGVTGPVASSHGYVWLAFTNEALRFRCEIVREATRQLDAITMVKRELMTSIIEADQTAKRFAEFLGFEDRGEKIALGSDYLISMIYRSGKV